MKKKVLIMTAYYTPAVKGGGPIQSIKNLVDNLSDKIDFYIVTSDRDVNDNKPFTNIITDHWIEVGNAKVFYTNTTTLTFGKMKNTLNSIDYDVIYLNSFFSYKFSIMPILLRKLNRIPQRSIVVAPRGEFSEGALKLKKAKKKLYINLAKVFGLYKNINWHATAETEEKDIEAMFGDKAAINVAYNLTANYQNFSYEKDILKEIGKLKIVFVSRITPKKNLKKAIELLNNIVGEVEFNIYGPVEDRNYWNECKKKIYQLPNNIEVSYKGIVKQEDVLSVFRAHHVFLFPTLAENFGHVISEALIGGCPVVISDETPWNNLNSVNAGWDISLEDEDKFRSVLNRLVKMDQENYNKLSKLSYDFGIRMSNKSHKLRNSYNLFL